MEIWFMPVIAVVNRKGGSGKSTLATHLAAWLAAQGMAVMLGDVDRQQSTRAWLRRRSPSLPAIVPWAMDEKNVLKAPPGVTHVVLDTPGGMRGFELAKVVMSADAIIIPVCNSMFDRESASACVTELMALPRGASGRCRIGLVGMRIDARTRAAEILREWAKALHAPFLGVLRETQLYVRSLENGQTIFDQPASVNGADLRQWEPILEWLQVIARPAPQAPQPASAPRQQRTGTGIGSARAPSLMPAQEVLIHGSRLAAAQDTDLAQTTNTIEAFDGPRFLLREARNPTQNVLI
jgi:chromosome partitioning protein